MIESRIPGGRYVTSILICLLVLTAATASAVYLYHALVLPMVLGVSSLFTTGTIAPTALGALIGSLIGSIFLYLVFRYMSGIILASYRKVNDGLGVLLEGQNAIGRRLDSLESRVSVLEK